MGFDEQNLHLGSFIRYYFDMTLEGETQIYVKCSFSAQQKHEEYDLANLLCDFEFVFILKSLLEILVSIYVGLRGFIITGAAIFMFV